MTSSIHTEAIVLQAIPFKEYDRILTLFAPSGICKLFAKGSKKNYLHQAALTSPLTHAEFVYTLGRKDLHRLTDGTILKQHLAIRQRFETLAAAEQMIQALLTSQWPGKPAPKLFALFALFLQRLTDFQDPSHLVTAFLLKILKHEGILQLEAHPPSLRFGGECYSQENAPQGALCLTLEEEELLAALALCHNLSQISALSLAQTFQKKIELLFFQAFK